MTKTIDENGNSIQEVAIVDEYTAIKGDALDAMLGIMAGRTVFVHNILEPFEQMPTYNVPPEIKSVKFNSFGKNAKRKHKKHKHKHNGKYGKGKK